MLKGRSGELVSGWPFHIARQLNAAPLITRLYPLDLTLLVSSRYHTTRCLIPHNTVDTTYTVSGKNGPPKHLKITL